MNEWPVLVRFETGMNEIVAVFDGEGLEGIFCVNEVSLRQRIANLKKQPVDYDPSSDEAVLCELAKRNRERESRP